MRLIRHGNEELNYFSYFDFIVTIWNVVRHLLCHVANIFCGLFVFEPCKLMCDVSLSLPCVKEVCTRGGMRHP